MRISEESFIASMREEIQSYVDSQHPVLVKNSFVNKHLMRFKDEVTRYPADAVIQCDDEVYIIYTDEFEFTVQAYNTKERCIKYPFKGYVTIAGMQIPCDRRYEILHSFSKNIEASYFGMKFDDISKRPYKSLKEFIRDCLRAEDDAYSAIAIKMLDEIDRRVGPYFDELEAKDDKPQEEDTATE